MFNTVENGPAFPPDLLSVTEKEKTLLNDILASVNISPKIATLFLLDQTPSNSHTILTRFRALFSETPFERTSKTTPRGYCEWLVQAGLATKEDEEFQSSDLGEKLGKPLGAACLLYEAQNTLSLAPILGPTALAAEAKSELRVPYLRTRCLLALYLYPEISLADLMKVVDLTEYVSANNMLIALAQAGLLQYESPRMRENTYEVAHLPQSLAEIPVIQQMRKAALIFWQACYELHQNGQEITRKSIMKILDAKEIQYDQSIYSRMLSGLVAAGFLREVSGGDISTYRTSLPLTTKGVHLIENLLLPIWQVIKKTPQGEEKLKEWQAVVPILYGELPQVAQTTAELYYPFSRSFLRHERNRNEVAVETIVALLKEHPSGLRWTEITTLLANSSINFSLATLKLLLSPMLEAGVLSQEKEGTYYRYQLLDESKASLVKRRYPKV